MRTCDRCGDAVSERYWRVFAVDGTLHGCLNCDTKTSDHRPAGSGPQSASD